MKSKFFVVAGVMVALAGCQSVMKSEPKSGTLPFGKKVYVDDGTCPSGQIKQITGGKGKEVPRQRECVARPDGL